MTDKRNIVMFCSSVATVFGGSETYVIGAACYLSKDFNIKLIAGRGDFNNDFKALITDTSVHYYGFPMISRKSLLAGLLMKNWITKKINSFDLEALSLLCSFGGIRELLKDADLIEVHYPLEGLIFPFMKKETKKMIHFHGPWLPPIYNRLRGKINPYTDMLVTCSDWSRRELNKLYGITGVRVSYNGVDADLFRPQEESVFKVTQTYDKSLVRIGTVGRLGEAKGTDLLIKVAKELQGVAEFFAVGPCDEGFLQKIKERGQPQNFHFLGPCPNNRLPEFYNFIDCFALPSLFENFPVTVLEAMSSGTPVVASNVGGLPEIIDDRIDGILVPPRDVTALRESIMSLVENKSLRYAMAKGAREKILSRFTHKKVYDALRLLYEEVLEPRVNEGLSKKRPERTDRPGHV